MSSTETLCLKIPLGLEAHTIARQFAIEQATPQKGKQTYLNTLAVYAVHSYLKWLHIKSDLSQGDSWHPVKQALFNVADLVLPNIGKLECRPVQPGESAITLPLEAMENRIGYMAVQFSERLNEVELLGFIRAVAISPDSEQISITSLQPLDALLDCLPDAVAYPALSASQMRVNLSQWLDNIFETDWQTVEALLRTQAINLDFSTINTGMLREIYDNPAFGVTSAKLIDLGMQLADLHVVLMVKIVPKTEIEVDIRLRVYPARGQIYLPPSLQLMVWDETQTCLEAEARSIDNWIQLEFSGEKGEHFSVKVALGDVSVTEDFVI